MATTFREWLELFFKEETKPFPFAINEIAAVICYAESEAGAVKRKFRMEDDWTDKQISIGHMMETLGVRCTDHAIFLIELLCVHTYSHVMYCSAIGKVALEKQRMEVITAADVLRIIGNGYLTHAQQDMLWIAQLNEGESLLRQFNYPAVFHSAVLALIEEQKQ